MKPVESSDFPITINAKSFRVKDGTSVAAAILMAGQGCRVSVTGQTRSPFCGMGICMECRAKVDGVPHQRTCQVICEPGMSVVTE